jgi:hypothetical protein
MRAKAARLLRFWGGSRKRYKRMWYALPSAVRGDLRNEFGYHEASLWKKTASPGVAPLMGAWYVEKRKKENGLRR